MKDLDIFEMEKISILIFLNLIKLAIILCS